MKNKLKRILGMLLVLALCLSFVPATAFAAPVASDTNTPGQAEEFSNEETPNDPSLGTADEVISEPDEIISEPDAAGPEVVGYDTPLHAHAKHANITRPLENGKAV